MWDVTCPDTFAPFHLPSATREAGAVAAQTEWNKQEKYASINQRHNFTPVAIKTAGGRVFHVSEGSGLSSQTGHR